jgi:hypothetical protein
MDYYYAEMTLGNFCSVDMKNNPQRFHFRKNKAYVLGESIPNVHKNDAAR